MGRDLNGGVGLQVGAQSALPKIITTGFRSVQLIYFFTAGEDEVKCWQVRKGSKAPQVSHSGTHCQCWLTMHPHVIPRLPPCFESNEASCLGQASRNSSAHALSWACALASLLHSAQDMHGQAQILICCCPSCSTYKPPSLQQPP